MRAEVVVRTKLIEHNGSGCDLVPPGYMLRLPLNPGSESQRERLLKILAV
jgi:hypothetical protein